MTKTLSRREFLRQSAGTAISTTLPFKQIATAGSLISTGLLSSCVSTSTSVDPIIDEGPVHYPKLPGQKIQSPEHYGLEGCMTSISKGKRASWITIPEYNKKVEKLPSAVFLNHSRSRIPFGIRNSFIKDEMIPAVEMGVIPIISYDARRIGLKENVRNLIPKGKYDKYIKLTAKNLKSFGDRYGGFFIRTMQEMNLFNTWPWGGSSNKFKKAWIHIWNIFDGEGANEYATWIFNPYVVNDFNRSSYKRYYPGDKFVDWVAFNGFNFYGQGYNSYSFSYISFENLFVNDYKKVRKHYPNKPILIAETGTNKDKFKQKWVTNTFNSIKKMKGIKLLNWWDDKWSHNIIKNFDTRIDSSPEALHAFKTAISDPYFLGPVSYRS